MDAAAVIVGVDEYPGQPLTSAVNDAVAFRDALVDLGLVESAAVTLLTSPADHSRREATRDNIGGALRHVYEAGGDLDRLYVYFAGHGLQAPVGAARSAFCTAFMPADVRDPAQQAFLLLNVDDLRVRLRYGGPAEQFFFVDACRDLIFGEYPPDVPLLGWPPSPNPTPPRAQATLFAVSPYGKALGARDGMGVMTTHLIDALYGRGLGLDYSEDHGSYVVTMESVYNHVYWEVLQAVSGRPLWEQQYMRPDLVGSRVSPIRFLPDPAPATLTVTIEPQGAARTTRVVLAQRRCELREPCWPPHLSGERVHLEPQRYEIRATPRVGSAHVDPPVIDLRVRSEALVTVGSFTLGGDDRPRPPERRPGAARITELPPITGRLGEVERADSLPPRVAQSAHVSAVADEPHASIELEALQPPYTRWQAGPALDLAVPPGSHRIRFRTGAELFSEAEFELGPGSDVEVTPAAAASSLVQEMLGEPWTPPHVVISESIGPIQSGVLPTLLAVIGVGPFDSAGELGGPFIKELRRLDPGTLGRRPLSVVVAVDGAGWPAPVEEVVGGIECEAVDRVGGRLQVGLSPLARGGAGLRRVALGVTRSPSPAFSVVLRSPLFGRIELAAASLPDRVSVVTATLRPEGHLDVTHNLLRLPGGVYDEPVPAVSYGRVLRELQLGQLLYAVGKMVDRGDVPGAPVMRDLLHARWTDPVLGCMAYYAWDDAERPGQPAVHQEPPSRRDATARALLQYFAELPDVRIIQARQLPERRTELLGELLERGEVPVLARSLRELARMAREVGAGDAAIVARERRLAPGSIWTLSWDPNTSRWQ